jgi:hypothetical protein
MKTVIAFASPLVTIVAAETASATEARFCSESAHLDRNARAVEVEDADGIAMAIC